MWELRRLLDRQNSHGLVSGKPVYKQEGGEHYLYFQRERKAWMVGARVGHRYGWVRNASEAQHDALLPDLPDGWQYQPLARDRGGDEARWRADDATLTVEALGGLAKGSTHCLR